MQDIKCKYSALVESHKLVINPKNPNKHSPEQIERLAKIIDFQGQRAPVVVSNQTGFIIVGHGRLEAMKKLGWEKVAVDYQDFKNEAEEYAHMVADNAIAEWSKLDLGQIDLGVEGLDIDLDFLGIENFKIEELPEIKNTNEEIDTDNFGSDLLHQCPKCGFEFNE
jgi:hypothetical protein